MTLVIHRLRQVPSTQDEARRLVESGEGEAGHVVVADHQTEGRGRFGRSWLSPVGGLYATFIVARHAMIPLISGVAVLRALARFGVNARFKWPNDLVVDGRKLAGVLIETVGDAALVGIGINLADAPLETATSALAVGADVRRGGLIVAIWEEMSRLVESNDVLTSYREDLTTLGRQVVVALEGGDDRGYGRGRRPRRTTPRRDRLGGSRDLVGRVYSPKLVNRLAPPLGSRYCEASKRRKTEEGRDRGIDRRSDRA